MLKVKAGTSLEIMRDIFRVEDKSWSFQHKFLVKSSDAKSVS